MLDSSDRSGIARDLVATDWTETMADSCGALTEFLLSEEATLRYDEIMLGSSAQTDPEPLAGEGSFANAVAKDACYRSRSLPSRSVVTPGLDRAVANPSSLAPAIEPSEKGAAEGPKILRFLLP
jgi:hypothetical protein